MEQERLMRTAREKRETAARVRRLALGVSATDDHLRLMQQAEVLEAEAGALERQAGFAGS